MITNLVNQTKHMDTPTGIKLDAGKAPMSLLDRYALEQIASVLAFGAKKYAAHNWRGGIAYSRLTDAALRHLFAFADGEDVDAESGLPHLAHAGCCILFALGMTNTRPDMDDRYKAPATPLPEIVVPDDMVQPLTAFAIAKRAVIESGRCQAATIAMVCDRRQCQEETTCQAMHHG